MTTVKASKLPDDLEIAPEYTICCWKTLSLDPDQPNSEDWKKALEIFDARIRRRFLDPVDALIEHEANCSRKTFGFAILAIDFLVIETLQGFREGVINHDRKSKDLFVNFLTQWSAFRDCTRDQSKHKRCAELIYKGYRCALHHSGSTDDALRVLPVGPTFVFENDHEVTINRTCLHNNLKDEFDTYLADLRAIDKRELRCNFKKKMDAICGL